MKTRDYSEAGFSMMELLTVTFFIFVMSGMALVAYSTWKQSAVMGRADATYRNARTKLAISELDLPDGYSLAYTSSATDGQMFTGDLGIILPGMSAGPKVKLSVALNVCDSFSNPLDMNQLIVIEPCDALQKVQWQKFCGGIEVYQNRLASASPCS